MATKAWLGLLGLLLVTCLLFLAAPNSSADVTFRRFLNRVGAFLQSNETVTVVAAEYPIDSCLRQVSFFKNESQMWSDQAARLQRELEAQQQLPATTCKQIAENKLSEIAAAAAELSFREQGLEQLRARLDRRAAELAAKQLKLEEKERRLAEEAQAKAELLAAADSITDKDARIRELEAEVNRMENLYDELVSQDIRSIGDNDSVVAQEFYSAAPFQELHTCKADLAQYKVIVTDLDQLVKSTVSEKIEEFGHVAEEAPQPVSQELGARASLFLHQIFDDAENPDELSPDDELYFKRMLDSGVEPEFIEGLRSELLHEVASKRALQPPPAAVDPDSAAHETNLTASETNLTAETEQPEGPSPTPTPTPAESGAADAKAHAQEEKKSPAKPSRPVVTNPVPILRAEIQQRLALLTSMEEELKSVQAKYKVASDQLLLLQHEAGDDTNKLSREDVNLTANSLAACAGHLQKQMALQKRVDQLTELCGHCDAARQATAADARLMATQQKDMNPRASELDSLLHSSNRIHAVELEDARRRGYEEGSRGGRIDLEECRVMLSSATRAGAELELCQIRTEQISSRVREAESRSQFAAEERDRCEQRLFTCHDDKSNNEWTSSRGMELPDYRDRYEAPLGYHSAELRQLVDTLEDSNARQGRTIVSLETQLREAESRELACHSARASVTTVDRETDRLRARIHALEGQLDNSLRETDAGSREHQDALWKVLDEHSRVNSGLRRQLESCAADSAKLSYRSRNIEDVKYLLRRSDELDHATVLLRDRLLPSSTKPEPSLLARLKAWLLQRKAEREPHLATFAPYEPSLWTSIKEWVAHRKAQRDRGILHTVSSFAVLSQLRSWLSGSTGHSGDSVVHHTSSWDWELPGSVLLPRVWDWAQRRMAQSVAKREAILTWLGNLLVGSERATTSVLKSRPSALAAHLDASASRAAFRGVSVLGNVVERAAAAVRSVIVPWVAFREAVSHATSRRQPSWPSVLKPWTWGKSSRIDKTPATQDPLPEWPKSWASPSYPSVAPPKSSWTSWLKPWTWGKPSSAVVAQQQSSSSSWTAPSVETSRALVVDQKSSGSSWLKPWTWERSRSSEASRAAQVSPAVPLPGQVFREESWDMAGVYSAHRLPVFQHSGFLGNLELCLRDLEAMEDQLLQVTEWAWTEPWTWARRIFASNRKLAKQVEEQVELQRRRCAELRLRNLFGDDGAGDQAVFDAIAEGKATVIKRGFFHSLVRPWTWFRRTPALSPSFALSRATHLCVETPAPPASRSTRRRRTPAYRNLMNPFSWGRPSAPRPENPPRWKRILRALWLWPSPSRDFYSEWEEDTTPAPTQPTCTPIAPWPPKAMKTTPALLPPGAEKMPRRVLLPGERKPKGRSFGSFVTFMALLVLAFALYAKRARLMGG